MFTRHLLPLLAEELQHSPAVALLGPRQSGKTTLALEAAKSIPSLYLDLESERDRAKLARLAPRLERLPLPAVGVALDRHVDQAERDLARVLDLAREHDQPIIQHKPVYAGCDLIKGGLRRRRAGGNEKRIRRGNNYYKLLHNS